MFHENRGCNLAPFSRLKVKKDLFKHLMLSFIILAESWGHDDKLVEIVEKNFVFKNSTDFPTIIPKQGSVKVQT